MPRKSASRTGSPDPNIKTLEYLYLIDTQIERLTRDRSEVVERLDAEFWPVYSERSNREMLVGRATPQAAGNAARKADAAMLKAMGISL